MANNAVTTNAQMSNAIRNRKPFQHRSYRANNTTGRYANGRHLLADTKVYQVIHWDTTIAEFDAETGTVLYFNGSAISSTTSKFQGQILRTITKSERDNLLDLLEAAHGKARARQLRAMTSWSRY
jgi:hypothetical protein